MNLSYCKNQFILCLCTIACVSAFGDFSFSSIESDYYRGISLIGLSDRHDFNYRYVDGFSENTSINEGPWAGTKTAYNLISNDSLLLHCYYPDLFISYNTARNWGGNDAISWQGRGTNLALDFGLGLSIDWLILNFHPRVYFYENSSFAIIPTVNSSGYGDYWTVFDNLQRPGDDMHIGFSLGATSLRVSHRLVSLGIGTENIIIGPGRYNNILLSQNAEGFPHVDFGTNGSISVGHIGKIEAKILWGWLKESEFFDTDPTNDYGWFSGFYASVSPEIIPNLSVGFNHQYYKPLIHWDYLDLIRGIPLIDRSNEAGDTKDMMASVTFSFLFPKAGFELYGEWARNDNFGNIEDLFKHPEHTQGYTIGVDYGFLHTPRGFLSSHLEFTSLQQERTREIRAAGPWYRHGWDGWTQGFTNKGQLIGAAIGPGSNSQTLSVSWTEKKSKTQLILQRIVHDKDYYYTNAADPNTNVFSEFNIGIDRFQNLEWAQIFGRFVYVFYLHNNYEYQNNISNFHIEFGLRYVF